MFDDGMFCVAADHALLVFIYVCIEVWFTRDAVRGFAMPIAVVDSQDRKWFLPPL